MNQQRAGEGTTVVTGESTEQGDAIARGRAVILEATAAR